MINKQTLINIVNDLIDVCESTELNVSHDLILTEAIRIYISSKISQDKKENIKSMNTIQKDKSIKSNEQESKNEGEKATPKQITLLIKNGFNVDIDRLTKKEAWNIIKELKNRRLK